MKTFRSTLINGNEMYKFNVTHDLNEYGVNIAALFKIWSLTAKDLEEMAFCIYAWKKHQQAFCIPTKQYKFCFKEPPAKFDIFRKKGYVYI